MSIWDVIQNYILQFLVRVNFFFSNVFRALLLVFLLLGTRNIILASFRNRLDIRGINSGELSHRSHASVCILTVLREILREDGSQRLS